MAQLFNYKAGDELPGLNLPWQTETSNGVWEDLDLSSGYTFTLRAINTSTGVDAAPACSLSGYDGGVTVAWTAGALAITAGRYAIEVTAREVSTSKDRTLKGTAVVQISA